MFYLNYVGCKVKIVKLLKLTQKSFTLTMWDVKVFEVVTEGQRAKFYLNYVGCKVNKLYRLLIFRRKFYLNYVGCKVFQEYEVLYKVHSFTLTMWDVKTYDTHIEFADTMFYLNYVGCKVV